LTYCPKNVAFGVAYFSPYDIPQIFLGLIMFISSNPATQFFVRVYV
jgi:hypothetical protein